MIGAEKTMRAAEQEVQGAVAQAKGIRSIGASKSSSIRAEAEAEELGATGVFLDFFFLLFFLFFFYILFFFFI